MKIIQSSVTGSSGSSDAPLVTTFIDGWVNQGTKTAMDTDHGLVILSPAISPAVDNVGMLLQPLSTGSSWSYVAQLAMNTKSAGDYAYAGIVLRDSVSGKLLVHAMQAPSSVARFIRLKLNSPTSFNADSTFIGVPTNTFSVGASPGYSFYYKVACNGTNIIYSVSRDSFIWDVVSTFSKTDFCTPNQIGLAVQSFGTHPVSMLCESWSGP